MAVAVLVATTIPASGQESGPPPAALTRVDELPNYFYDAMPADQRDVKAASIWNTYPIGDPANGVVFEMNPIFNEECRGGDGRLPFTYNFVAYDTETFEIVRGACAPWLFPEGDPKVGEATQGRSGRVQVEIATGGSSPLIAVDPVDKVVFWRAAAAGFFPDPLTGSTQREAIVAVSEETLDVVSVWNLPSNAHTYVRGMSWYAPKNQLLVLTIAQIDQGQTSNAPRGARLTAYDVPEGLAQGMEVSDAKGNLDDVVEWTIEVPGCSKPIYPRTYPVNAYRSARDPGAVFVLCLLRGDSQTGHEQTAVVKIEFELDAAGDPKLEGGIPKFTTTVTPTPGPASGIIFDPGSDRAFIPVQFGASINVLAYDGDTAEFFGRTDLGLDSFSVAVDERTGRLYLSSLVGHTLLDGRRTPFAPGTRAPLVTSGFPGLPILLNTLLPPTEAHPYVRWIVNDRYDDPAGRCQQCELPYFTVIADTFPVTDDPPLSELDSGTFLGEIPPGVRPERIERTYGGTARAYGVHSNLVEGIGGVVSNVIGTEFHGRLIPIMSGSRNVLGGFVRKLSLSNEDFSGRAAALADANKVSGSDYERCTNAESAVSCLWPPIGLGDPPNCEGLPTPDDACLDAPEHAQRWPYPDAECAQPGPEEARKGERAGYYTTRWETDGEGNSVPTQEPVPGTERHARAEVICSRGDGSAWGQAFYEGIGTRIEGFPPLNSGSGEAVAWIEPPEPGLGNPSVSTARAYARNIIIDFGLGNFVAIGEVFQEAKAYATGRPEPNTDEEKNDPDDKVGAETERIVEVRNVLIGDPGGVHLLCELNCAAPVFDQINSRFVGRMKVIYPLEDPVWAQGSPGGFTAAVQTHPTLRHGDVRFHGASEEEAAILPGLRVILYNDGPVGLSRQIIDLAGVYVQASLGVELLPEPPPATVKIQLTDDADPAKPLAEGTFEVYSDSNANGALDELVDSLAVDVLSGQAALCVTGADGTGNCSFRLAPGNYVVHEVNPPPGYSGASDFPSEGGAFSVESPLEYTVNFVNLTALGGIEISLTDGSSPLEGGNFSVVKDEDRDGTVDSSEPEVATCTTDDEGTCTFNEVAFGAYIVSQQKAPDGYVLAASPVSFAIDEPREIAKVAFVNLPAIGMIKVTLKDDSPEGKPLTGGVFEIYSDDGDRALDSGDEKLATCTTDSAGRCVLKTSEVTAHKGAWASGDCSGTVEEILRCLKENRSNPPSEGPGLGTSLGTYLAHQQSAPGEFMKSEDVAFGLAEPGQVAQVDFVNGLEGASGTVGLSRPGRPATQAVSFEIEEVPPPEVTSEEPSSGEPNTILRILRLPAEGLQLLVRDPGQAAVVGGLLLLLLLPLLASRRRRLWLQITTQT